jgi:hypothetical protein
MVKAQDRDIWLACLTETRALIAAGKLQRWDVVKWAVTVNLALATAAIALKGSELLFFLFSLFVAVVGLGLVIHYNSRMTKSREFAGKLEGELGSLKDPEPPKTATYDCQELVAFKLILIFSIIPAALIFARAHICLVEP